jgi:protocatechuate 3,4-dioxygenase beta subunit
MKLGAMVLAICGAAYGYQAAPAKGSIEGQVVNGKAGSPLKKATVQLVMMNPVGAGGGRGRGQVPVRKSAESDEAGRFTFTGVGSGQVPVVGGAPGIPAHELRRAQIPGRRDPVLVAEGQNVKSILFSMTPQAVIVGKVLDEDGEGLADQAVRAMRYVYRGGKRQWNTVATAQTSDIGEFRLPNLEPGRYLVVAASRNGGQNRRPLQNSEPLPSTPDMVYASTYYPSTTSATTATPVDVAPGGEIRGIDVRLVKTRVYRVRGKVVGSDDTRRQPP